MPNLSAFYGVLFPNNEEAAFSNYRLWESVGFIIAFAYTRLPDGDSQIFSLYAFSPSGLKD